MSTIYSLIESLCIYRKLTQFIILYFIPCRTCIETNKMKSWVGAVAFLLGCPLTKSQAPSSNIRGCIEPSSFDPSIDYFPDKSVVGYSKNWNVTYHSYYKVLTVTDTPSWSGATTTVYTYVLYQCGGMSTFRLRILLLYK